MKQEEEEEEEQQQKKTSLPKISSYKTKTTTNVKVNSEQLILPNIKSRTSSSTGAAADIAAQQITKRRALGRVDSAVSNILDEEFLEAIDFRKTVVSSRSGKKLTLLKPNYAVGKSKNSVAFYPINSEKQLNNNNPFDQEIDEDDSPLLLVRKKTSSFASLAEERYRGVYHVPEHLIFKVYFKTEIYLEPLKKITFVLSIFFLKFTNLVSHSKWNEASKLCKKCKLTRYLGKFEKFLIIKVFALIFKFENKKLSRCNPTLKFTVNFLFFCSLLSFSRIR